MQLRQTECIKLLLKSGARYICRNAEGKTAADIAREKGYDKCLELLGELEFDGRETQVVHGRALSASVAWNFKLVMPEAVVIEE